MEKKKKKADIEALNSSFMRIPKMNTVSARDLLDLGFREVYDITGRSPEALIDELKKIRTSVPEDRLSYFRMAVYYAENEDPDPKKLFPYVWAD